MNRKLLLGLLCGVGLLSTSQAQRRLTEATLVYKVYLGQGDTMAQSTSYLKGANSRTDLVTKSGQQSTIFLSKSAHVVLLKEFGGQRYLTRLTLPQWEQSNQKYREATLRFFSDTLRLAGYLCNKAEATLPDGDVLSIWYTGELNPLNKEFLPLAGSVPGLILSMETMTGKSKVRYTIDRILLNPVQQVLFDIPETGYRLLEGQ